ncbi:MAG: glycosyltransferase [Thermoanaerobaculia bacterium]
MLLFWVAMSLQTITNLLTVPRLRRRSPQPGFAPLVSVVIPARNEAEHIGTTVESMLAQSWTRLEVIVVDDLSTDATAGVVRALAERDSRVRLVEGAPHPEGWIGKPWALQQGGEAAAGELLLFVDADVRYAPEAIEAAVAEAEERPECAMFFLFPHFEMRGFWEKVVMPALPSGLFMGVPVLLSNRTTWPILGVGGGPGNLVRREAYEAIGRHTRLRDAVIDDIGLARLIRASGRRTRVLQADDLITLRMYRGAGEIIEGFTKNSYMVFAGTLPRAAIVSLAVPLTHLAPWVWTWLVVTSLAAGLLPPGSAVLGATALALILLTRLALFGALGFSRAAALLTQPLEVLVWQWIFLRSTWRLGVRRRLHWRGRDYPATVTAFGHAAGIERGRREPQAPAPGDMS